MQDQQAAKDAKLMFTANWGLVCAQECRQHLQLGLLRLGGIFGDVSPFTVWEGCNRWSAKMPALLCISKRIGTLILLMVQSLRTNLGLPMVTSYTGATQTHHVKHVFSFHALENSIVKFHSGSFHVCLNWMPAEESCFCPIEACTRRAVFWVLLSGVLSRGGSLKHTFCQLHFLEPLLVLYCAFLRFTLRIQRIRTWSGHDIDPEKKDPGRGCRTWYSDCSTWLWRLGNWSPNSSTSVAF